ncbi:hypothetical protein DYB32_008720 [Aphanomyces invadans]|uniref:HTH CENPB-type domain-containing protein n=1 Tax=Aphanomyces invadans TaxID=157072 RepID=A0A418AM94_9STRA|nr:hypothetical protein DYB32_008720 [Aphanomyces invadans]
MAPRTKYSATDMASAVHAVLGKEDTAVSVAKRFGIPLRTLRGHIKLAKAGGGQPKRMGPTPALPQAYEEDLVTWILAMESDGHPVNFKDILSKANAMMGVIHGSPNNSSLTHGWYHRFMKRHSVLTRRKARVLTAVRRAITADEVYNFFHELVQALACVNMDPKRVFNMDETSFSPSTYPSVVVTHQATKHVFVTEPTVSSHVTIVACVGADGTKIPPLFVLPGDRVSTSVCDNLSIPGAAVTTSMKGWTNSFICRKWLTMLSDAVPSSVARPILLIVDGCSSHYSDYIVEECKRLQILLQFLPANSTHLFQPLDVSVFRPFKAAIRAQIADGMWKDIGSNITKQKAISVACEVWANATKATTITNGFAATGLCPPSLEAMMFRLSLFRPEPSQLDPVQEAWLQRSTTIRETVLLLHPEPKKKVTRKTISVSGKFITADYHALLQAQADAAKAKKKQGKKKLVPQSWQQEIAVV